MSHITKAVQQKKIVMDYADKQHWPKFSPEDRLKVFRKCGQPCFAKQIKATSDEILKNPKILKFPVCRVPTPKTHKCKVSASGLLAVNRRARLTKKYPKLVKETSKLITKLGTTNVARKEIEIQRVRVNEVPLPNGKHIITILYVDGVKKQVPYTKRHILKKYGNFLSKALIKRLSL